MPPKRGKQKAAAGRKSKTPATPKKAAGKSKRPKKEELNDDDDDEESDSPPPKMQKLDSTNTMIKKAFENLKSEELKKNKQIKLDMEAPFTTDDQVYEDFGCMLNQTNINANNNKFYVIQLVSIKQFKSYAVFTRWGRVGESGQQSTSRFTTLDAAIKEFKKKFKDKTKNEWDERENFVPQPKKYTLLDIDHDDDDEEEDDDDEKGGKGDKTQSTSKASGDEYANCKLDAPTIELIQRIFDEKMFQYTMENFNLDVKKMPLGKLKKSQISKGFDVLVTIENYINSGQQDPKKLEAFSSQFYTLIPHSFGRNRPVVIDNLVLVSQKKEMLLVLSDIELTQSLQKDASTTDGKTKKPPNPWVEKYNLLKCSLSTLPKASEDYKIINTYMKETSWSKNIKLLNVWKTDRETEGSRFSAHDSITERKLLWHGTNIAVVAAILASGLRIMPHSGGRVGRGIYFASEHSKSFAYTSPDAKGVYLMFLNEVALGKEYTITMDDSSLKTAPGGFDSVVARGSQEPDPKCDIKLKFDGKTVIVPQGKPTQTKYSKSSFSQSEYLVYKESQVRIRYVVALTNN